MASTHRMLRLLLLLSFVLSMMAGCAAPAAAPAPGEAAAPGGEVAMTEVGTPRNETLIVQTFDGKTNAPDNMNPLMSGYSIWRGFRELAWGYLWEMDTATGQSYPELAAELPTVLNDEYTQFEIKLRPGVYWSDGVEFTADDVIYTLDTYFNHKDKLTYWGVSVIPNYVKSYEKVDDYTLRVETVNPAYDFATTMGVYTWGSGFNIVPKHIFEKVEDLAAFKNEYPVTLGAYTLKSYDPNGQWHLWERREDWDRSATGPLGEPAAKYVFYKNFGDEQTRTLAFIKNEYDVDTFMSPDSIAAAQAQNPNVHTFAAALPYHDMNDACSYGIIMNNQKAPLDMPEVRWALALSLDLPNVGTNSMSGQFKASALPMPDTQITRPAFFEPLQAWLTEFTLPDGYKPYNPDFGAEMVTKLTEMGMDASQLPTGDAVTGNFGMGWWKVDPAQAEKLMNSVGMSKGADGFYTLPDGSPWTLELVIPSDWNKVMQRVGFSIADSWTKAGFKVNARQVDNGEFGTVQNTNTLLQTMVNWTTSCVFNTNFVNNWRSWNADNVKPVDSSEQLSGNYNRITNQVIFDKIAEAGAMDMSQPEFTAAGQEIIKEMITNMYYINMMNIPTTIPTNETYWTNFPKQENPYAVPYTWWSSFKKILTNIEPAAQ
ncbi:MAG: ABC transporter substrate-binding protein [Caldilineaceae bacterium]|nr:ABC transporter substrate-binding protein [Caldilineaceae bacterium]